MLNISHFVDKELLQIHVPFSKNRDGTFIVDLSPFVEVDIKQRTHARIENRIKMDKDNIIYPSGRITSRFLMLNVDDFFMLGILWGDGTASTMSREVVDPVKKVYKPTGSPIIERTELGGSSLKNMERFRNFIMKFSIPTDYLHFTYHYDTRTRIDRSEEIEKDLMKIFGSNIRFGTYIYSERTSVSPETHGESLTIGVTDSLVSLFVRSIKLVTPFIKNLLNKSDPTQIAAFLAGMIDAEASRAIGTPISFEQQLITWSEIEGIKFGLGERTVELVNIIAKKLRCNVRFSFSTNMLGTGYHPTWRMEKIFKDKYRIEIYSSESGLDFPAFLKHRTLVYLDFCEFCKYNSYFRVLFNLLINKRKELSKIFNCSDISIFKEYPNFITHVEKHYPIYMKWCQNSFPDLRHLPANDIHEELKRFLNHLKYVNQKMYVERKITKDRLPYKEFERRHTGGSLKLSFSFRGIPKQHLRTIYLYCSEKKAKVGYIYARNLLKEIKNEKVVNMLSKSIELQKKAINLMKEVKKSPGSLIAQNKYKEFEECWKKINILIDSAVTILEKNLNISTS